MPQPRNPLALPPDPLLEPLPDPSAGLTAARLAVHATLLKCLSMHRGGAAATGVATGGNAAYDKLVRHLPALLQVRAQPCTAQVLSAAAHCIGARRRAQAPPAAAAARWRAQPCTAQVLFTVARSVVHCFGAVQQVPELLQDCALAAAEDAAAAYMADIRDGVATPPQPRGDGRAAAAAALQQLSPALEHTRPQPSGPVSGLSRAAVEGDEGRTGIMAPAYGTSPAARQRGGEAARGEEEAGGTDIMALAIAPALLDPRITSTRSLERFRNHVSFAAFLRRSVFDVRDMYEDRCAPLLQRSDSINRRSVLDVRDMYEDRCAPAVSPRGRPSCCLTDALAGSVC